MWVMTGRTLFLGKNIMLVEIRRGSLQKRLMRHDVAVGAQAGCNGAYTGLVPDAVAEVALIARLHIDAPLIPDKVLVERHGVCQFDWFSTLLAQQRMTGVANSLLIGSEKLRVFGSMTFMTEKAVFQHRPLMNECIIDQLCFMAALPEAQGKSLGLFPLLDSDVMASLAFIL